MNPVNGYAAFHDDFENLRASEKEILSDWLAIHYVPENPPRGHKEKLLWLEQVYAQRDMDVEFWSRYYRLMACIFQDEHDISLQYVRKAIPFLEAQVRAAKRKEQTPFLFVLGEYHRRLGDESKAESYFRRVWQRRDAYFDPLVAARTGWAPRWTLRPPSIDMQAIWKRISYLPGRVGFGTKASMPTVVTLLFVLPNFYILSGVSIIGFAKAKRKGPRERRWGLRIFVQSIFAYAASWAIFYIPASMSSPQAFPWHLWFLLYVPFFVCLAFWIKGTQRLLSAT